MKNIVVKHKTTIFAPVFHGIRFKVKRLFVVRTSNFFFVHTPNVFNFTAIKQN